MRSVTLLLTGMAYRNMHASDPQEIHNDRTEDDILLYDEQMLILACPHYICGVFLISVGAKSPSSP